MSTLGDDLIEAMSEAVAYMSGSPGNTVTHEVRVPDAVESPHSFRAISVTTSGACPSLQSKP